MLRFSRTNIVQILHDCVSDYSRSHLLFKRVYAVYMQHKRRRRFIHRAERFIVLVSRVDTSLYAVLLWKCVRVWEQRINLYRHAYTTLQHKNSRDLCVNQRQIWAGIFTHTVNFISYFEYHYASRRTEIHLHCQKTIYAHF